MNIFFLIIVLTSSFSLFGQHHQSKEIELVEIHKKKSQWSHIFNLIDQKNNIDSVVQFLITQINKTPAGYIDIHRKTQKKASAHYRTPSQGKKAYQHILPLINLACIMDKKTKMETELKSLIQQEQQIIKNITGPDSPFISRNK